MSGEPASVTDKLVCTTQAPLSVTCSKCNRVMPPDVPMVYIPCRGYRSPKQCRCFGCNPPYSEWPGHIEPYRIAHCWNCGREMRFEHNLPLRYCSDTCRKAYAARQARQKRCPACGKAFMGNRADARTCSPACRQKAYRQRQTGAAS